MSMRDRIKEKADQSGSRAVGYLKLPTGTNLFQPDVKKKRANLNFIPYKIKTAGNPDEIPVGENWYRRGYKIHRNVGPEEKTVVCLKSIGKRCPVCEEYARLKKDADADPDTAEALKPKFRYLYNVQDILDVEKGIQIWDISEALFQRALDKEIKDGDDKLACFAEIEDGLVVVARFESKSLGGRDFLSCDRVDFKDRDEALEKSILKEAIDLDTLLITYSYDDLKAILMGADEEADAKSKDEDEEEEEEKPKRKAKVVDEEEEEEAPKKRKVSSDDDDDDAPPKKRKVVDEEEEEEAPKKRKVVDEDDEEAPPKKRKVVDEEEEEAPKKRKPVTEDDDDASPPKKRKVADEEEDEVPKKKAKVVKKYNKPSKSTTVAPR